MRSSNAVNAAAWLTLACTAAYVFAWLLPHKGVVFGDEGWYLAIARAFALQGAPDLFLPQTPFYIPAALLMKAGVQGILAHRAAYFLLVGASFALFTAGLNRSGRWAFALPMGVCVGLMSTLNSQLSYHNGPVLFCLAALGCAFLARVAARPWTRRVLAALAGALLGCSLCLNLVVFPSAWLAALLCWLHLGRRGSAWLVPWACALVFVAFYAWYIPAIGPEAFLRTPQGHGLDTARLALVLLGGASWPLLRLLSERFVAPLAKARPNTQRILAWSSGFLALAFTASPLLTLAGEHELVLLLRSTVATPVHWLVVFAWCALFSAWCAAGPSPNPVRDRSLTACACLAGYWMPQALFSDMALPLSWVFFAGPMLAVAVSLLASAASFPTLSTALAAWLIPAVCLGFTLDWNHPGENRVLATSTPLTHPLARGLLETPERAETLERLTRAFEDCGCRDKTFIAFRFSALLNYLFSKHAPEGLSYISPDVSLQERAILRALESGRPWCVFYSRNLLAPWWDGRERPVIDYLERNSERIVRIREGSPRHLYDDFVVYAGPRGRESP